VLACRRLTARRSGHGRVLLIRIGSCHVMMRMSRGSVVGAKNAPSFAADPRTRGALRGGETRGCAGASDPVDMDSYTMNSNSQSAPLIEDEVPFFSTTSRSNSYILPGKAVRRASTNLPARFLKPAG
jgi:hypothetical protein